MIAPSEVSAEKPSIIALVTVALCAAVSIVWVAVPLYVIRPFRPQGPHELALALTLRQSGPFVATTCAILALLVAILIWPRSRNRTRIGLSLALLLACAGAVAARVNIFEHMFHPYDEPAFDRARLSGVEPDDMVMVVQVATESRAYPIRAMGYHHIVNDTIGGLPVAVTYCTLCHTGLVWKRVVDGETLWFRLAGINNGNALMRDEQTGTIWQQTTGLAIFGPLKGHQLERLHSDELTFALWQREQPRGMVLRPDAEHSSKYESKQWEQHIAQYGSVIDTSRSGIKPRELMIGVSTHEAGKAASKAYPLQLVLAEKLIQDHIGTQRVLLLVGPDNTSVRVFRAYPDGSAAPEALTFLRQPDGRSQSDALMIDSETASAWNFEGCAVAGKLTAKCLQPLDATKDYWFDWLNYHADSAVYRN